jgi:hypothetical protein
VTNATGDQATKALAEGERRSREAALPRLRESALLGLWRRHKWKVLVVLFLLLTEMCLLLLGGSLVKGPG